MKNSTKILGGLFLLIIIASTGISSAFACQGDARIKGLDYSPERHEAIIKAFETNDFVTWKELMSDRGRITEIINADNFARFVEAHNLAQEGKLKESKAIRDELGLGLKNGDGRINNKKELRLRQSNGQEKRFKRENRSELKDSRVRLDQKNIFTNINK